MADITSLRKAPVSIMGEPPAKLAADRPKYHYNRFGGSRNIYPDLEKPQKAPEREKRGGSPPSQKAPRPDCKQSVFRDNNYVNNYVCTGELSTKYIRNIDSPVDGYPRLQRLKQLKQAQVDGHAVKPYGCRVELSSVVSTLNSWINSYGLQFDVIMIGGLVENQFILPLLLQLPLHKLCSKPGFLFIWSNTNSINQLLTLLNNDKWNGKFRRSEELVFVPVDEKSPFFPGDSSGLFEKKQWHCWMCITGTVKRSLDSHLIHCNVDTDLQIESTHANNNAVPDALYQVAENFSNSNRRLHILPSRTGYKLPIRLRRGWVIMSPDVMVDNFDAAEYSQALAACSVVRYKQSNGSGGPQYLVPQSDEVEELRPKTPTSRT